MFKEQVIQETWECPHVIRTLAEFGRINEQRVWLRKARQFLRRQVQLDIRPFTDNRMTALDIEIAQVEARLRAYAKVTGLGFPAPDTSLRAALLPEAGIIKPEAGIKNTDCLTVLCCSLINKRVARGLTQTDVANAIGLSTAQLSRYERENYAHTTIERVRQIMRLFNDSFD